MKFAWKEKLLLSFALPVFFCAFYFPLQHISPFPTNPLPSFWIDRAIPFEPAWIWVYQSLYLMLPILPWLAPRPEFLRLYAKGFFLLCCISFLIFFFYPTESPRPESTGNENFLYLAQIAIEGKRNAFPSLHAGLCAYSLFFGAQIRKHLSLPVPSAMFWTVLFGWTACILYSTIATRQHYAIDLIAGAVLARLCHLWVWRTVSPKPVLLKEEFR